MKAGFGQGLYLFDQLKQLILGFQSNGMERLN